MDENDPDADKFKKTADGSLTTEEQNQVQDLLKRHNLDNQTQYGNK